MRRALVVDDHDENLYYLRALLEGSGWTVETARHGEEALTRGRAQPPDVVISDLLMPVMDGYTLLRNWKADPLLRPVPFVVYTATYTAPEDEKLARSLGADEFLLKPLEPGDLLARVIEVQQRTARAPPRPDGNPQEMLELYNRALVTKLEHKLVQLEEANRRLLEEQLAIRVRDRALRAVSQGIFIVDAQRTELPIVFVNPAFERMSGYPLAELQGRSWLSPYGPADLGRLRELIATGQEGTEELLLHRKDGSTYWAEVSLAPVVDPLGKTTHFVGVQVDVTERRGLAAKAMAMDRMMAMATLAAGVGHEINNPLAFVQANLSFALAQLAQFTGLAPPQVEALGEVQNALKEAAQGTDRVRKIIQDLKTVSSSEPTASSATADLHKVLDSSVAMAQHEIRPKARLVRELPQLPRVRGNEGRLGQVFLNLLVNAAQATPGGAPDAHRIQLAGAVVDAEWVKVEVSDSGAGISPEVRRRLFEPFVTTKAPGVGTGLGLAICKRIVEEAGGRIEADNAPGRGATFRVFLRIADGAPQRATLAPAPLRPPGTPRILAVDDEPLLLRAITRSLAAVYSMATADSGLAALERIRGGERYDLILCDLSMPGLDGMELYQELLRSAPDQAERMAFLSGGALSDASRDFLARREEARIDKPFTAEELSDFVERMLCRTRSATASG